MPGPQITLQGSLQDIMGAAENGSSLVVQLCNFGNYAPRIAGTAIIAKTSPTAIACPAGTYNFQLYGNDAITPANTYYTIQVLDDNGNVVQTNAYQFSGSHTYDLSNLAPYDPTPFVPPVPPAPQPGTLDVVVPFAANAIFNALNTAGIITFEMTLTADLTTPTLINLTPGQFIVFKFVQDGTGSWTVTWMAQVHGGAVPDPAPGAISSQLFYVDHAGQVYNLGPQTVN
jgi:hypothetical protein